MRIYGDVRLWNTGRHPGPFLEVDPNSTAFQFVPAEVALGENGKIDRDTWS